MTCNVAIAEIYPNPYHPFFETNVFQCGAPILDEEVNGRLKQSLTQLGQYIPLLARKREGGGFELAFGHHRTLAARELGWKEVTLDVQYLTDEQMIRYMLSENESTFNHNGAEQAIIAVEAGLKALCEGKLPSALALETGDKHNLRFAPRVWIGSCTDLKTGLIVDKTKPYTATSLAKALGCTKKDGKGGLKPDMRIEAGLAVLECAERGAIQTNKGKADYKRFIAEGIACVELGHVAGRVSNSVSALYRHAKSTLEYLDTELLRRLKTAEEIAQINAESLRIQAEQKAKEKVLADERKALVKTLADAKREEDKQKVAESYARLDAREKDEAERESNLLANIPGFEAHLEQHRQQVAEQRKVDTYKPIRNEVDRICHTLEGNFAMTDFAIAEAVKALVRHDLHASDRERLRQAALKRGSFFTDTIASHFLPPFSAKGKRRTVKL